MAAKSEREYLNGLEIERDHLQARVARLEAELNEAAVVVVEARTKRVQAQADLATCRSHVRMALNELGVPGPGYPAPVANAVEHLNKAMHVIVGTALLHERDQLREKVKWLEALNDKGVLARIMEGGQWLEERDAALARVDRLRALLMLAYEELEDYTYADRSLVWRIIEAVSPGKRVTEAGLKWAREQLSK